MAAVRSGAILRLFVTGVRWTTSRNEVYHYFSKYGKVDDVYQPINLYTGYPLFHGVYVTMATPDCVKKVLQQRVHTIEGKNVHIRRAQWDKRQQPSGRYSNVDENQDQDDNT